MRSLSPLLLLAVACNIPPTPPEPPDGSTSSSSSSVSTTGEVTVAERCEKACDAYRANGCTQAVDVCKNNEFDDAGECTRWVTCDAACEETPDFYLDRECEVP